MKRQKQITVEFPLKRKVVRDCKIVTEQLGVLKIKGVAYFNPTESVLNIDGRYAVDIENVEGNLLDTLECGICIEEIHEFCLREAANLFEEKSAA